MRTIQTLSQTRNIRSHFPTSNNPTKTKLHTSLKLNPQNQITKQNN